MDGACGRRVSGPLERAAWILRSPQSKRCFGGAGWRFCRFGSAFLFIPCERQEELCWDLSCEQAALAGLFSLWMDWIGGSFLRSWVSNTNWEWTEADLIAVTVNVQLPPYHSGVCAGGRGGGAELGLAFRNSAPLVLVLNTSFPLKGICVGSVPLGCPGCAFSGKADLRQDKREMLEPAEHVRPPWIILSELFSDSPSPSPCSSWTPLLPSAFMYGVYLLLPLLLHFSSWRIL